MVERRRMKTRPEGQFYEKLHLRIVCFGVLGGLSWILWDTHDVSPRDYQHHRHLKHSRIEFLEPKKKGKTFTKLNSKRSSSNQRSKPFLGFNPSCPQFLVQFTFSAPYSCSWPIFIPCAIVLNSKCKLQVHIVFVCLIKTIIYY